MTDGSNSIADDLLRNGFERWQRLEGEKAAISEDLKELFGELKAQGLDGKALRAAFRKVAKAGDTEADLHDATVDLYVGSLLGPRIKPAGTKVAPTQARDARDEITPPQPTKAAEQQHDDHAAGDQGEAPRTLVAGIPDIGTPISNEIHERASTDDEASSEAGPQAEASLAGDRSEMLADREARHEGQAVSADLPTYPHPGDVYWENTPRRPVKRHEYSTAFGTLGQDIHVITEDIAKAQSAAIVMMGDTILDGWARFMVARGMVGMDGQTTDYPAYQYDGTDPLLDCIRWNLEGRILDLNQRQIIAKRLIEKEPKRKADIIKAFGFIAEVAA
jgi:uncharacterized protein (UPF0335 family)